MCAVVHRPGIHVGGVRVPGIVGEAVVEAAVREPLIGVAVGEPAVGAFAGKADGPFFGIPVVAAVGETVVGASPESPVPGRRPARVRRVLFRRGGRRSGLRPRGGSVAAEILVVGRGRPFGVVVRGGVAARRGWAPSCEAIASRWPSTVSAAARRRERASSSSGSGQAWSAEARCSAGFSSSSAGSSLQTSISPYPAAVLVEGLEEVRGSAGTLLGGPPPVTGTEQQGAGAGEGDVAEAQLLGVLVLLHGLVEGLQSPRVPGRDVGQGVGVAAQGVRQHLALGRPLLASLGAGEGAGDQPGDGDDVPLQALGLVGG